MKAYNRSAGVIGLDVALLLAERGHGPQMTVVAEHMPGDTSINYTSPWYVSIENVWRPEYLHEGGLAQTFRQSQEAMQMRFVGTNLAMDT